MRPRDRSFCVVCVVWFVWVVASLPWIGSLLVAVTIACGGGGSTKPHADATGEDPDGPPGDDGPRIDAGSGFVCDPVHQTGCTAGQKCDIGPSGTFACVDNGVLGDFRVCEPLQPNACAAGFSCRETFFGDHRCARLCNVGEDQCRADEPCNSQRETSDGKKYRMCATNQVCNPILDDCSTPSEHCTFSVSGGFCFPPGSVADGELCQTARDCKQGSACLKVGPGDVFKCVKLCNPAGGAPECPASVACTQFATVGPQAVGACGFP